jgi:hypothetical protein
MLTILSHPPTLTLNRKMRGSNPACDTILKKVRINLFLRISSSALCHALMC